MSDSRVHAVVLTAPVGDDPDPHPALDRVCVLSPGVGVWRADVRAGRVVRAGETIGWLTVLGVSHRVVAGPDARGAVTPGAAIGPVPVGHGQALLTLDRAGVDAAAAAVQGPAAASTAAGALAIRAPSSGRFYGRPGPGKPAFVAVGDALRPGQTVGLLEVMKSFHRVTAGDDVPPGARVTAIVVADDADVDAGAVLIRLEAPP